MIIISTSPLGATNSLEFFFCEFDLVEIILGTGSGGESAFSKPFNDEFDTRLSHSCRGMVSMANSGPNTNSSQFFITFKECKYLDLKHTIFAKVVGGIANLDRLEAV